MLWEREGLTFLVESFIFLPLMNLDPAARHEPDNHLPALTERDALESEEKREHSNMIP